MRRVAQAAAALSATLGCGAAQALCTLVCSCSVSTTAVVFGTYAAFASGPLDGVGGVRVACGGIAGLLIPYVVEIGPGGSGSEAARQMASGPHRLDYGLYRDAARTQPWGSAAAGAAVRGSILLDVLGSSSPVLHTVYGRVPAGQRGAAPGSYADALFVTVTYE